MSEDVAAEIKQYIGSETDPLMREFQNMTGDYLMTKTTKLITLDVIELLAESGPMPGFLIPKEMEGFLFGARDAGLVGSSQQKGSGFVKHELVIYWITEKGRELLTSNDGKG